MKACIVCAKRARGTLCSKCKKSYIYEPKLKGARLRKIFKSRSVSRSYNWKNEQRLYKILKDFYGEVYRDLRPEWSRSPKNVCLEYDFCIPSQKILIELDGPYHWDRSLHKSDEEFEYRQLCDHLKEVYADENGWRFFRINLKETRITREAIKKILGYKSCRVRWFKTF